MTPGGEPYKGIKISVRWWPGDPTIFDEICWEIEKALTKEKVRIETHEEKRPDGRFKSYSVRTI